MILDDGFCKVSDFGLGCIPFMAGVRLWVCQEDRRPYVDALWNARVSRARAHPVQGTRQGCGLVSLITPLIASLIAPLIATLIIDFSVVAPSLIASLIASLISDRFSLSRRPFYGRWALGILIYEMLSGFPPYGGESPMATCDQL